MTWKKSWDASRQVAICQCSWKNFVEEWQRTNEGFHFQSCEISGEFRRIFIQWITLRCWEKSKEEQRLVSTYKHQYWLSYAIVQIRYIKSLGIHFFRISYTWLLFPAKTFIISADSINIPHDRRMLSQAVIVFTSTSATYYFWALLPAWEVWYRYGLWIVGSGWKVVEKLFPTFWRFWCHFLSILGYTRPGKARKSYWKWPIEIYPLNMVDLSIVFC
jgi:hypothetical protein